METEIEIEIDPALTALLGETPFRGVKSAIEEEEEGGEEGGDGEAKADAGYGPVPAPVMKSHSNSKDTAEHGSTSVQVETLASASTRERGVLPRSVVRLIRAFSEFCF